MASRAGALASSSLAALAFLIATTPARAQQEGAPDGTVALRIVGSDDPALRDSIRELLARLHLAVAPRTDDAGASGPAVARVQIDLSSPTDAVLLITDDSGELRVRRSVPRDASSAIVREEIAHAVQSEVESAVLAARERAARPAPPPSPPSPAPVVPSVSITPPPLEPPKEKPLASRSSAAVGLEFSALGGVEPIADGAGPGMRIGLGATLVSRGTLHPGLTLAFLYAVPFDAGPVGSVELSAHASIISLRLLPSIELFHGRWLALDLGAGGGIDVVNVTPHVAETAYVPPPLEPASTREDPMLSAIVTAYANLAPGVELFLAAGLDVDLASRSYVMSDGRSNVSVLSPWQERPIVLAGLAFSAVGDTRFSAAGGR